MSLNKSLVLKRSMFRYILISMIWCQSILLQYFRALLMRLPIIGAYPDTLIVLLYAAVILLALPEMKTKLVDLLGIFGVFIVYILSPIIFPETMLYWEENSYRFLTSVLPLYVVGLSIGQHPKDHGKVIHYLYTLSMITVIVRILFYYTSGTAMTEIQSKYQGDMDGAYNLLPHLCLIMYHVIKKKGVINIAVLAVGSLFLLFLGTRGAVLMEVICFVLMVLLLTKWKHKVLTTILIAAAAIAYLYSPLFDMTMQWLSSMASDLGLSIRIFDLFRSGTLGFKADRDVIADTLYAALARNPLGYGLYGDWVLAGTYAHKIYLEMWIHFGVILGTVLIGVFLLTPVRAFIIEKNADMRGFLIALYCSGVLKLFLSSSYLREELLFLLFGLSIALLRKKKPRMTAASGHGISRS